MAEEDQTWLEALAGRSASGSAGTDISEAKLLRELLGAHLREDTVAVAEVDPSREAMLIARARADGLLPALPPASRPSATSRSVHRAWWLTGGGLAAAAVLATVLLGQLRPAGETFRGMDGGTVRLESAHPQALKDDLLRELNAAGVRATGYDRLGRLGIDADLPQPLPTKVQQLLERHHIPIPKDGALAVEIESAGSR
jgi:hypothetical protein